MGVRLKGDQNFQKEKVNYDPFKSGALQKAAPTTRAQKEIWSTLILEENATLCYNEAIDLKLKGRLDRHCLEVAFQEVIKRHDSLRCLFSSDGKNFLIKEYEYSFIEEIDCTKKSDEEIRLLKEKEVHHKFDLVNGPCFQVKLLKLADELYHVYFTIHHIVCDGWSLSVILREWGEFYTRLLNKERIEDELPTQMFDFSKFERDELDFSEDKKYWHEVFGKELKTKSIPIEFKRPTYRSFHSSRFDVEIPSHIVKELKKYASQNGVSYYAVLMSAYNVLLHKLTQANEVVVGMASSGQMHHGEMELVGHLVNLVPLRVEINPKQYFKDWLKIVKNTMLDAFDHQSYGYGDIVKDVKNIPREPGKMPLLSSVFNIDQQDPDQSLRFKDLSGSYKSIPRAYENFEIFVNAVSCQDFLHLECQYNSNLFSRSLIENWFSGYLEVLRQVIQNENTRIEEIQVPYLKHPKTEEEGSSTPVLRNFKTDEKTLKVVSALWRDILILDEISLDDNFFKLGGHSLLAIELAQKINKKLDTQLTIKDIFERPTIEEMVDYLVDNLDREKVKKLPPIENFSGKTVELNHNQMQIWYIEEVEGSSTMHNLPAAIRIKDKVNRTVLEKTLNLLIEKHAGFRTKVVLENGRPKQTVDDFDDSQFYRLSQVNCRPEEIGAILNHEADHHFNLYQGHLLKAKLFKLDESDYVFFFMVHHFIWDGWSFDIFFDELNKVYSSFLKGDEDVKVEEKKTYFSYVNWLSGLLHNNQLEHELNYWTSKLAGPLPVLEVPLDYKRPLLLNHDGDVFFFKLEKDLVHRLKVYAKENQSSLYNVFLCAFKITLSRYAGIDDIIVGTPVRCRENEDLLTTIGYFVNTLALRTNLNHNTSFEENLRNVAQNSLEAFDHQQLPFQIVLNSLKLNRDKTRTPVFQTFFSYQDVSNRSGEFNGKVYSQINVSKASTHTDLDLWIKTKDDFVEGGLEYRKDLFKKETIARFFECFKFLLESIDQNLGKPLNIQRQIPHNQEDLINLDWNNTWKETSGFKPLHKMFEEMARKHPNNIAVVDNDHSFTYKELNDLANKGASALRMMGVSSGDLVGISMHRDIHMIGMLLGILKTGAGYVPLDPGFPQDRLDYMIESSTPKALIVNLDLKNRFEHSNCLVVDYLIKNPDLDIQESLQEESFDLEQTAYVIYTSGSTGKPKGVQIPHRSLTNFLISMKNIFNLGSESRFLALTTLSFDIAVLEIYLSLIQGASIFLATGQEAMDGNAIRKILETKNISHMQATPSTWRLLLANGWRGDKNLVALCGGEAFPLDLAKKLIPITQSVWNMYGPTETTVWSSCKKLNLEDEALTVGRPIENTTLYVLDNNRFLRPIGATGELFIGGLGLALGYFKREDLTTERFIDDPFIPGSKMYATGDLARFRFDGEVECLGRNDGQVKVRGYRIELGEIEAALQHVKSVKEAAVVTKEVRPGDVRIIAYVSFNHGDQKNTDKQFREILSASLPHYMLPNHYVHMEEIPKTLNGKIDKKSLPAFKVQAAEEETSFATTNINVNKDEKSNKEILRAIWIKHLVVQEISDKDNYFDLGGNSLMAVEIFVEIQKTFNLQLQLSSLVESENFDEFYGKVEKLLDKSNNKESVLLVNNDLASLKASPLLKSIVSIREIGDKNPLFCFHSVGGNVLNYINLIPALKGERSLYGLQSYGLDGIMLPLESIEEMAKRYIQEIKMIQPNGPYLLSGGSMGGLIALEVADQLTRSGEKVDKLIMFDTFGTNFNLRTYNRSEKIKFSTRLKQYLLNKSGKIMNIIQSKIYRTLGMQVPQNVLLKEIERINYKAIFSYSPKKIYRGDLHLIRSRITDYGWYSDPDLGWRGVIQGKIIKIEIDGSHENFIESTQFVESLKRIL